MKRSLIMLLVVALLSALLVPAMAEEAKVEPKLTSISVTSEKVTKPLYRGNVDKNAIPTGILVNAVFTGDMKPVVYWESKDTSIADIYGTTECTGGKDGDPIPALFAHRAGTVEITGDVYDDKNDERHFEKLATLSFTVELTVVKETAIEFTTKEYKVKVGDSAVKVKDSVTVKPNDDETGSTYDEDDLTWSVSDESILRVDKNGNVTILDSDRTETVTAEVYATAKGDPSVKGSVKFTVYPKDAEKDKQAFKTISFSTKTFEVMAGDEIGTIYEDEDDDWYQKPVFDLMAYLSIDPFENPDTLVWSSSNPQIAWVSGNKYYVTATISDTAKAGDTVTITAASKLNPEVSDFVTLTVVEGKPYKALSFTEKSIKVKKSDGFSLREFLTSETYGDARPDDGFKWSSSNPEAIKVSNSGYLTFILPETEVTITVRSKREPDKVFASIVVSFEKEKLESIEFTKDLPTEISCGKSFNIWEYVNTKPWYYTLEQFNDEIDWTSSDANVAYVVDGVVTTKGVGTATITATSENNPAATAKFTLTVKAIPVTAVTFNKDANYKMKVGKKIELGASDYISYTPADYSDVKLTWTSSDDEVATVDFDGCVTGKKAGTAEITVLVRNADGTTVEGKVTVTVVDADNKLTGFAFKKSEYKLEVGNSDDDYSYNDREIAISKMVKFTPADIDVTAYDWDKFDFYTSNDDIVKFVRVEGYSEPYFVFRTYKPGTVTLTAQSREDETLKAETTLVVEPIKVKKIARPTKYKKIEMPLYDVVPGSSEDNEDANTKSVHVIVTPSYAYYEAKWETSDASVAYVTYENNNKAVIRAVAPGTCKIKVTIDDGSKKYTRDMYVVVKAAKVTKLALNRSKVTGYIIKGAENTFQLTASDAKTGYEVPVKWTSSNAKVAKVYQSGLVKFLKAGTAKITATTKDGNKVSKSCTFTVKKLAVTEVVPASKSVTIKVGGEKTLKAKVKPAKAFNTALYFKSSDTKVVAVDQDGVVLGLKPGKATITISARDGSKKKATITVYVKAVAATNDGELEVLDGDLAIEGDLLENSFDIDVAGEDIVIADDEAVELSID